MHQNDRKNCPQKLLSWKSCLFVNISLSSRLCFYLYLQGFQSKRIIVFCTWIEWLLEKARFLELIRVFSVELDPVRDMYVSVWRHILIDSTDWNHCGAVQGAAQILPLKEYGFHWKLEHLQLSVGVEIKANIIMGILIPTQKLKTTKLPILIL